MAVDYNDSRFTEVEEEKKEALSEIENSYDSMIGQSDNFYQAQIDASKQWANQQSQLQQEQTDFAIEQIQQQKDQQQKDYIKEQSAAYKDWQKQSNAYGANAEAMAAQGMSKTGYSESSQVSMYNAYQNRVATARESYNNAVIAYDNAMTEARLQNNAVLAEIAATALQQQLELALSGFQYKNSLLQDKMNQLLTIEQIYYNRRQDVLSQINTENALAEEQRQFNESLAETKRANDIAAIAAGTKTSAASDDDIQASINALGLGSLSASQLADLIEAGIVKMNDNGTVSWGKETGYTAKDIIDAGLGPISQTELESQIASGNVKTDASGQPYKSENPATKTAADTLNDTINRTISEASGVPTKTIQKSIDNLGFEKDGINPADLIRLVDAGYLTITSNGYAWNVDIHDDRKREAVNMAKQGYTILDRNKVLFRGWLGKSWGV